MPQPGLCLNPASPINWAHPTNVGLVSEWANLPGGQWGRGTLWRDLNVGKQNSGTLTNGPTWQGPAGRPGGYGAMSFVSGSSQYAVVASSSFTGPSSKTWSCWLKTTQTANSFLMMYNGSSYEEYIGLVGASGVLRIECYTTTGAHQLSGTAVVNDGSWHHVARVNDYAARTQTLYIDGTVDIAATSYSGTLASEDDWLFFGAASSGHSVGGGFYYSGLMDEILIRSVAMSSSQIKSEINESRAGNPNRWSWVRPRFASGATTNRRRRVLVGAGAR